MFAPQSIHSFKSTRSLILILFLGLFVAGVHDELSKKLSDDALEIELISQDSSINGAIVASICESSTGHNLSRIGPENPVSGSATSFITSFANDSISEDERIHPPILPFFSSIKLVNNLAHQRLVSDLVRYDFSDLSLKILSSVVLLH